MSDNIYKATIQYAGDEFFIGTTPSGHAQRLIPKAIENPLRRRSKCCSFQSRLARRRTWFRFGKEATSGTTITGEDFRRAARGTSEGFYTNSRSPYRMRHSFRQSVANPSSFPTPNIAASPRPSDRRGNQTSLKLNRKSWILGNNFLRNTVKLLNSPLLIFFFIGSSQRRLQKPAATPEQTAKTFYQWYLETQPRKFG